MTVKGWYHTQRNITHIFSLTTNSVYRTSYTAHFAIENNPEGFFPFKSKFKLESEMKWCSYFSNEYISDLIFLKTALFNVHLDITL